MPSFNYLDIELMEKMCHPIAVAVFDTEEDPIARFNEHELSLLDSALNNPKQTFQKQELYTTLAKKVAVLYYGLIKNHPFRNGNKRIATASLLVFLFMNDYWLIGIQKENEDYLVNLAQKVAGTIGDKDRDLILKDLEDWLDTHLKKRD